MRRIFLIALFCAMPMACDSGGSGGLEVLIVEQNAQEVASQGIDAVDLLNDMADLAEIFTGVLAEQNAQVIPCDAGNVSFDINDVAPLEVLSVGDSLTMGFNACVINVGELQTLTLNGSMSIVVMELTGEEPGPFTAKLNVNFGALTVVAGGETLVVNGGFTLEASSQDGVNVTNSVSGNSFSVFATEDGQSSSVTISNFNLSETVNDVTGDFSATLDATVSGSEIGGYVTYETPVAISGTAEDDNPSSGVLEVTGAQGSKLSIVVLDDVNVQLQVDVDGDGEPEVIINTTWDELDGNAPV